MEYSRESGNVVLSLDTIYAAGTPYGIMRAGTTTGPEGRSVDCWYLMNLSARPIMTVVPTSLYSESYNCYVFDDNGYIDTAYAPATESIWNEAKAAVSNGMIVDGKLNQESARRLVAKLPRPAYGEPNASGLVIRNRGSAVTRLDGDIWQGGVVIGHYDSTAAVVGGIRKARITVRHFDSRLCAVIWFGLKSSDDIISVVTERDKETHVIQLEGDSTFFDRAMIMLLFGGYL
jgi:hypothetical protein